ncbi:hypothetical protein HK099_006928 [Clydaea vesicula]|uniref:Histone-lysine N-methyltransferase SET5 n=1 Tax=Clydaea vesicula TaxID=447962 RepID=A0AAD5XU19_9FUNG|nr:hypothetical protein HK099_006928 [Clydaea vesicula]
MKSKQAQYKEHFPKPEMNVKLHETQHGTTPEGKQLIRRGLVLLKDVKEGEVIFSEDPFVSSLFIDKEESDYCSNCLDSVTDFKSSKYCSAKCHKEAWSIFGGNVLYPEDKPEATSPETAQSQQSIRNAVNLAEFCKEKNLITPLLTVKLIGKMMSEEQQGTAGTLSEYSTWDHIDRFHYIDLAKPTDVDGEKIWFASLEQIEKEYKLVFALFNKTPKFDKFLTDERYMVIKGKFLYNAISIISENEVKKTEEKEKPKGEYFKSSTNKSREVGVGLYHIASYLSHSCEPNVEFKFGSLNKEKKAGSLLNVVAKKDLTKGDEIFINFVDTTLNKKQRKRILKEKV